MVFEDIFSKSRLSNKPKPRVVADFREKNSLLISELVSRGLDVSFEQLEVGDYLIGEVVVERKTFSDLESSIFSKRIIPQLSNLSLCGKKLLLVEDWCDPSFEKMRIHPNALKGFLLSVSVDWNIPILFSRSFRESAELISILSSKANNSLSSLRSSRSSMGDDARLRFILEGFPGIGPSLSHKLLSHFSSLKDIANSEIESISKIIGKKAKPFFGLVNKKYLG
jgi:ERCC4-type nuclease